MKGHCPFHGLLLVNKPKGCTSHDVVARARKVLGTRDVGHAGTLDPLASGLLILLVGHGTKLSDFILSGQKTYEVVGQLGQERDTGDAEGKVTVESEVTCSEQEIRAVINDMQGDIELPVPMYSAIKVRGKKLYEYAREGIEIEPIYRTWSFKDVQVQSVEQDSFAARLSCSKGAYIRAWVQEVGRRLGCGAYMAELCRTHSQPFDCEQAVTLDALPKAWENWWTQESPESSPFLSLLEALPHWGTLWVDGHDEKLLLNGQISRGLNAEIVRNYGPGQELPQGVKVVSRERQQLISLLTPAEGRQLRIRRVFPT